MCGKGVLGSAVEAGGKTFHPDCFKCSRCKKKMAGRFSKFGDMIVCPACRDQAEDEIAQENIKKRQQALERSNRLSSGGSSTTLVDRSSGDWARKGATLSPATSSTQLVSERSSAVGSSPLARNSGRHGSLMDMHREESRKSGLGVPGRSASASRFADRASSSPPVNAAEGAAAPLSSEADEELLRALKMLSDISVAVTRSVGAPTSDDTAVKMAASSLSTT